MDKSLLRKWVHSIVIADQLSDNCDGKSAYYDQRENNASYTAADLIRAAKEVAPMVAD